jgi:hypothetical protein
MRPSIGGRRVQPVKESKVAIKRHRGSRRSPVIYRRPSAEEVAAVSALGRQWRDEWRAAQAANHEPAVTPNVPASDRAMPAREASARKDFATAIARAEFGRFYWDERRTLAANGSKRAKRRHTNAAHE